MSDLMRKPGKYRLKSHRDDPLAVADCWFNDTDKTVRTHSGISGPMQIEPGAWLIQCHGDWPMTDEKFQRDMEPVPDA